MLQLAMVLIFALIKPPNHVHCRDR